MGGSAVHFSDPLAQKQGENGVKTGFDVSQPFELLEEIVAGWKESDRLDVLLLRAICVLSMSHPDQIDDGFPSHDIVEEVGRLRGRPWSSGDDKNQMSDDVRRYWNKLLATWEAKEEGIIQRLADAGASWVPRLGKTEGGGAGRPSRYRVEWSSRDAVLPAATALVESAASGSGGVQVRYISEDIEEAGVLARMFARGYHLKGWRRWVYMGLLGGPMLLCWLATIDVLYWMATAATIGGKTPLTAVLSMVVAFLATWSVVGSLLLLGKHNIVIAPWWMQSDDDDRLLERRYPPRYSQKMIKAVRYTTQCPLCGGRVSAKSGGFEFWGRLVGRCEHAPDEHVYSFDHVTRNGRYLR
ncbi:hypothetical protein [Denitromonas ohlonensis]|uniref:Uncharacterized protein n=2 Tax=Denitromonas TaxID=139331 RepID=A0A557S4E0_9RHOO|nr:hypothetical protein [Denitromonas ohlonensis]TVO60550.1 hypothetical protein FHP90_17840 [Denitromonas ohlonensis]TVO72280.1 hypothetical protein FHP89_18540 [Denitromonas ohlonensis]